MNISDETFLELECAINTAQSDQELMQIEIKVLEAKIQATGKWRVKLMDIRDRLKTKAEKSDTTTP